LETGDFSRAASEYERTLILMSRQVGTKQEDLAHVQKNLAKIYEKAGRIANAQEVLHHAIAILERSKGPELAESLELMARLFIRTGRYSDAQRPLERAQAIWMEDSAKFVEQLAANAEIQRKLQDELASIAESRRTSAESA
jgi:tetratricopeptide (TPR) repeat protein